MVMISTCALKTHDICKKYLSDIRKDSMYQSLKSNIQTKGILIPIKIC